VDLLGNKLVVVAPGGSKLSAVALERDALVSANRTQSSCYWRGQFGANWTVVTSALEKLGFWADIQPRLAAIRECACVTALVARGEAALGIVYETDAKAEPRVNVVLTFPDETHPPIIYPFTLTVSAKGEAPARFLAFLRTEPARKVFTPQGFTVPRLRITQ